MYQHGIEALISWLDAECVSPSVSWPALLGRVVEELADSYEDFNWTGLYLLDGDQLHLGPFVGPPTDHMTIPVGRGICGAAVVEQATIVVDDVNADSRYLSCFATTRSEIVVPIIDAAGRVVGEIDVDSNAPAAFSADEKNVLEAVATRLAALAPAGAVTVPAKAVGSMSSAAARDGGSAK